MHARMIPVWLLWAAACASGSVAGTATEQQESFEGLTRELTPRVEEIRQLTFRRPVDVEIVAAGRFQQLFEEELEVQLPAARAQRLARVMEALGFVEETLDLRAALLDLMLGQVVGLYDPRSNTYLVAEGVDAALAETVSAHELTHALTDQQFDLDGYLLEPARSGRLSEDALLARQFITEGDATLVMMEQQMVAVLGAPGIDREKVASMLRMGLDSIVRMPIEKQVEMLLATPVVDASTADTMRQLAKAPAILVRPLLAAYMEGAVLVAEVRDHGGWAAVDSLYTHPPSSSEQVLHIEKLLPTRDEPRIPDLGGALDRVAAGERVLDEVLGELYVRTLFEVHGLEDAASRAAGWGGDRVVLVESGAGDWSVVWATTWDTATDAGEFASGMRQVARSRGGEATAGAAPDPGWESWRIDGRILSVVHDGEAVVVCYTETRAQATPLGRSALAATRR